MATNGLGAMKIKALPGAIASLFGQPVFFWIDRKNGIGGFWATQILPFVDPISVPGYFAFETAVFKHLE